MHYLRIENDTFGFGLEGLHEIRPTDIKLTDEEYNRFFELQSKGKQFRIRKPQIGSGLFNILEEYTPEISVPQDPTLEQRLKAVEMAMLEVL